MNVRVVCVCVVSERVSVRGCACVNVGTVSMRECVSVGEYVNGGLCV